MINPVNFALAVPVFHGTALLGAFLDALDSQAATPSRSLFIDSSRDDATATFLRSRGHEPVRIPPPTFDHGGTRNLALDLLAREGFDVVLFMTQDAVLASPDSIKRLLSAFEAPEVAAAFGRQVPRQDASLLELVNREVRYPPSSYRANDLEGQRRYFISNAFAAYRVSSLRTVGGFPAPSLFAEDAVASFRLQQAGFDVVYVADAVVRHSHPVSLGLEVRRYFDVGVATRQPSMPQEWGSRGSGAKATLSEWKTAWNLGGAGPLARSVAVSIARAVGMTVGRQAWLPPAIGRRFAYSKAAYEAVIVASRDARL